MTVEVGNKKKSTYNSTTKVSLSIINMFDSVHDGYHTLQSESSYTFLSAQKFIHFMEPPPGGQFVTGKFHIRWEGVTKMLFLGYTGTLFSLIYMYSRPYFFMPCEYN